MPTSPADKDDDYKLPSGYELDRIITLDQAAKISSLSRWAWQRSHPDKVVQLSPKRYGVRLRDALMLRPSPPTKDGTRRTKLARG
jgi:hypothetical protein